MNALEVRNLSKSFKDFALQKSDLFHSVWFGARADWRKWRRKVYHHRPYIGSAAARCRANLHTMPGVESIHRSKRRYWYRI